MKAFEVRLVWELEEGVEIPLVVSGKVEKPIPSNRHGHPDTWTPGDEGGVVDLEVRNEKGTPMPGAVQDVLRADKRFVEAVEEALH